MNKQQLKQEIIKQAKDAKITEIEMISAMQAIIAKSGDSKLLEVLCEIKSEYIDKL